MLYIVYANTGHLNRLSWLQREKETGQIFEENIVVKNDQYQINKTYFDGSRNGLSFSATVQNDRTKTSIHLSSEHFRSYPFGNPGYDVQYRGSYAPHGSVASFDMEIRNNQTEKYKAKLILGNHKIFDAWFYDALGMNRNVKDLVNTRIPSYLNQKSCTLSNFILADITNKFERFAEMVRQNY